MAPLKYIGENYTTPDLVAKVTGRAKYAEDFRADGMLFCKLLLSPMPHARVRRIDCQRGARDAGGQSDSHRRRTPRRGAPGGGALTNEPVFEGEPILAVGGSRRNDGRRSDRTYRAGPRAAPLRDRSPRSLAAEQPQPPHRRQRLGTGSRGAAKRDLEGAASNRMEITTLKWTEEDFAAAAEGQLPMGEAPESWSFGDLDAGFRNAALVVDETFVVQATSHQSMETRSAMAYWQNGKLYLYGSTQSTQRTRDAVATWAGIDPSDVVFISRVHGRRLRQQGPRRALDGHPGAPRPKTQRAR